MKREKEEGDIRNSEIVALKVCATHIAQESSMVGLSNYVNLLYSLASVTNVGF